jgi:hypothetical protein
MRQAFNFYRSYWEVAKELNDKDRLAFYDALLTRQFTGQETDLNGLVKFAYLSQKHSIDKQIKGYEDKTKRPLLDPSQHPSQGGTQGGTQGPSVQEKEKGKEQGKEQGKVIVNIDERKLKFADTLKPFIETYGRNMLNEFYAYWSEQSPKSKKMRFEMERAWGIERRLATWHKNALEKMKPQFNAPREIID